MFGARVLTVFFLAKSPDAPRTTIMVFSLSSIVLQEMQVSPYFSASYCGLLLCCYQATPPVRSGVHPGRQHHGGNRENSPCTGKCNQADVPGIGLDLRLNNGVRHSDCRGLKTVIDSVEGRRGVGDQGQLVSLGILGVESRSTSRVKGRKTRMNCWLKEKLRRGGV